MALMDSTRVDYRILPKAAQTHCLDVECCVSSPCVPNQVFGLPVWIPGSYMLREFARHIVRLEAFADETPLPVERLDKARWRVCGLRLGLVLRVRYTVYAWDDSVRAAFFDEERLFFNGTSVLLWFEGQAHLPCSLVLSPPAEYPHAPIKTTLLFNAAKTRFEAPDYDTLVDHPVEIGLLDQVAFEVEGVLHEMAFTAGYAPDSARLTRDLQAICQTHARFWGGLPFDRYLFLVRLLPEAYGGLEHAQSTALHASPLDLPFEGMQGSTAAYRRFLGLCSHEYFHAWWVKRVRPASWTATYDYFNENYTTLLWLFEGFTSYYDELALLRAGVIDSDQYLEGLSAMFSGLFGSQGRFQQTLADASFDAWVRYYRPNENTPNASVSYYTKGALLAFWLDLRLRALSQGQADLDKLMKALWALPTQGPHGLRGIDEETVLAGVARLGGAALSDTLKRLVWTGEDPDMVHACRELGLLWEMQPSDTQPVWLGARYDKGRLGGVRFSQVLTLGPAQMAGLWAEDELIALDDVHVSPENMADWLARKKPGQSSTVHYFRAKKLRQTTVVWTAPPLCKPVIRLDPEPKPEVARLRVAWMGTEPCHL
jgi:predicted metalloprotease with PDZ domain